MTTDQITTNDPSNEEMKKTIETLELWLEAAHEGIGKVITVLGLALYPEDRLYKGEAEALAKCALDSLCGVHKDLAPSASRAPSASSPD